MPRPKTKAELLQTSEEQFEKLLEKCEQWQSEVQKDFSTSTMNRNPRDILAHIHIWHLMYIDWHTVGMNGGKAPMPAEGYTWSQCPQLNKKIWEDNQDEGYEDILNLVRETHQTILHMANSLTEEELFERKRYRWTASTFVAQYMISALSSHYEWGIKLLRKAEKAANVSV